jgi:hypothetical protein
LAYICDIQNLLIRIKEDKFITLKKMFYKIFVFKNQALSQLIIQRFKNCCRRKV